MIARWQLDGNAARLMEAACKATINLSRPELGFSLTPAGPAQTISPLHILGVAFADRQPLEAAQIDAYVRGDDLVATYDESLRHPLRAQIYWRSIPAAEFAPALAAHIVAAFDLILSSNTSLLDSDPQLNVRSLVCSVGQLMHLQRSGTSQLPAQQITPPPMAGNSAPAITITPQNNNTGCFMARLEGTPYSYVEMVHPVDFCRSTVTFEKMPPTEATSVLLEHHLFQQRLEKGVILRARIRSALVGWQQAEAAAQAAYQHFAAAEPPLTV